MTNAFKYSLLKYVHSQFLGEELNIGIVLHFPSLNKLVFRYPKKIGKFKSIYRSFPEPIIRTYLKSFEINASHIEQSDLGVDLNQILNKYFLVKDASPLQFTESKSVLQYSEDWARISEQYFKLYFPEEFPLESSDLIVKSLRHRSDKQIATSYKKLLQLKEKNIAQYLKPSVEIKSELAHFRSDLVWQNHTTNAVKGLSFDLSNEDSISDRALLFNAKLNYLSAVARSKNIRFDLLVASPQNPDFKNAFDNALQILHDIKAPKEIITEEQLDSYATRTLLELER